MTLLKAMNRSQSIAAHLLVLYSLYSSTSKQFPSFPSQGPTFCAPAPIMLVYPYWYYVYIQQYWGGKTDQIFCLMNTFLSSFPLSPRRMCDIPSATAVSHMKNKTLNSNLKPLETPKSGSQSAPTLIISLQDPVTGKNQVKKHSMSSPPYLMPKARHECRPDTPSTPEESFRCYNNFASVNMLPSRDASWKNRNGLSAKATPFSVPLELPGVILNLVPVTSNHWRRGKLKKTSTVKKQKLRVLIIPPSAADPYKILYYASMMFAEGSLYCL
ncbi:uncharacterized protein CLUP02_10395 [Colletotrichum lupini]|uniref:Uncharacterized protein n=1 Tax=Colletotrichum lupini TaxID=145971 RepID=A0A9Q8SWJ1_9PEZI|nr:uncharacterized protein CLUP02_10395 [Colletotrichum lupini]UQC84899.1 hypothetical protein CLUP02_10395 [Colletotrichum lupini]